jgi:HAD superfamily hydrolase (TIGR01549 family)
MTARYQAILFDWDDTLCFAEPHRYLHALEIARSFGMEITLPEIYQGFIRAGDSSGDDWDRFHLRLPAEFGVDPDLQASFSHAYLVRDAYKRYTLYDDVLDAIEHLGRRDLRIGIISNNTEVARHVASLDVTHRFEVIVSPHTYGAFKPDPAIFRETLALMQVEPERVIYVGDSYDNDVVGARLVGMLPVLVDRYDVHPPDVDAEHRVATLQELIELLDRLLSQA